jgi:hypothetical protein
MSLMFILLCVMAYGKDTSSPYYSCESSAPFFVIYKAGRRTHTVLVIGLNELLGNPTT